MTKAFKSLTIDYPRWGQRLLRSYDSGKMCCLGFVALKCGFTPEEITGQPAPMYVSGPWPAAIHVAGKAHTKLTAQLMEINDSHFSPGFRMLGLFREFARAGVKLRFTNVPLDVRQEYNMRKRHKVAV